MLSLPLIAPQNEYTLFLSPQLRPPSPPINNPNHAQPQTRRQPQPQHRSSLAQLQSDELAITSRKHNIRRFGAGWIKPPGVTKTLQAETEERVEREEQEVIQRREQMMMDLQARQEVEEAQTRAQAVAEEGGERDLDDEIPDGDVEDRGEEIEMDEGEGEDTEDADLDAGSVEEAEEASYGDVTSSEDEEEEEEEDEEAMGDRSFDEESLLEGSFLPGDEEQRVERERYARLEEMELTGVAREREDLGVEEERDLDDSVPEAGEYQHTDSELEDTFSDGGSVAEVHRSGMHVQQRMEGLQSQVAELHGRSSFGRDVSSLLESSFVDDSSPVLGRLRSATHRANQR